MRTTSIALLFAVLTAGSARGQVVWMAGGDAVGAGTASMYEAGSMADLYLPSTAYPGGGVSPGGIFPGVPGAVLPAFSTAGLVLPVTPGAGGITIDESTATPTVIATDGFVMTFEDHPEYAPMFSVGLGCSSPVSTSGTVSLSTALTALGSGLTLPITGVAASGGLLFMADSAGTVEGFTYGRTATGVVTLLLTAVGPGVALPTTGALPPILDLAADVWGTTLTATVRIGGTADFVVSWVIGGAPVLAAPIAFDSGLAVAVDKSVTAPVAGATAYAPGYVWGSDGVTVTDLAPGSTTTFPTGAGSVLAPPYGMTFAADVQWQSAGILASPMRLAGPTSSPTPPAVAGTAVPVPVTVQIPGDPIVGNGLLAGTPIVALASLTNWGSVAPFMPFTITTTPSPLVSWVFGTPLSNSASPPTIIAPAPPAGSACITLPSTTFFTGAGVSSQLVWFSLGTFHATDTFTFVSCRQ